MPHAEAAGADGRPVYKFSSPTDGNAAGGLQNSAEYAALANLVGNTSPEIVRQVVRDQWEKCVLGSEYHISFLVSTDGTP